MGAGVAVAVVSGVTAGAGAGVVTAVSAGGVATGAGAGAGAGAGVLSAGAGSGSFETGIRSDDRARRRVLELSVLPLLLLLPFMLLPFMLLLLLLFMPLLPFVLLLLLLLLLPLLRRSTLPPDVELRLLLPAPLVPRGQFDVALFEFVLVPEIPVLLPEVTPFAFDVLFELVDVPMLEVVVPVVGLVLVELVVGLVDVEPVIGLMDVELEFADVPVLPVPVEPLVLLMPFMPLEVDIVVGQGLLVFRCDAVTPVVLVPVLCAAAPAATKTPSTTAFPAIRLNVLRANILPSTF
jgi:hypothetical protein